ncbi:MAG: LytTR family transcriptional regulator [Caulobacteraceae bacterium]|nr:MAG: LytTR family transcriptional regulator [Caulobacteraceae bacterium]
MDGRDFLRTYFQVLLVALPTVGAYVAWRSRIEPGPVARPVEPAPASRFFTRLPARLGTDLLCLQMEDHYVRAHTAVGSDLILMRMRDAVAELDALPGLQVHRSWWVAAGAVAGHRKDDRRLTLVLTNGLEVPVARSAASAVRQTWL